VTSVRAEEVARARANSRDRLNDGQFEQTRRDKVVKRRRRRRRK
jgi:hypothetical protein